MGWAGPVYQQQMHQQRHGMEYLSLTRGYVNGRDGARVELGTTAHSVASIALKFLLVQHLHLHNSQVNCSEYLFMIWIILLVSMTTTEETSLQHCLLSVKAT